MHQAKFLRGSELIEEEVVLQINGIELTGFANVSPCQIEEGEVYPVELTLFVIDEIVVAELPDNAIPSITRIGDGFAHSIAGKLRGKYVESCGISFVDDFLATSLEFWYLDGKMISIKADRIDVEFLEYHS